MKSLLFVVFVCSAQGKIKSIWITYALTAEDAIKNFNQMIEQDKQKFCGDADEWHPLPDDRITVEPVEFDGQSCYQTS